MKLTWSDLRYDIEVPALGKASKKSNKTKQQILKGVSGFCMQGTTTYILGASGSGKTSLLNCIADRQSNKNGARK